MSLKMVLIGILIGVLIITTLVVLRNVVAWQPFMPWNKDKPKYFNDSTIKTDFQLISKGLECHHDLHGAYPEQLQALDTSCMYAIPKNPNTGSPYKYSPTSAEQGYLLKAELSSGSFQFSGP